MPMEVASTIVPPPSSLHAIASSMATRSSSRFIESRCVCQTEGRLPRMSIVIGRSTSQRPEASSGIEK